MTGVQTCALPISVRSQESDHVCDLLSLAQTAQRNLRLQGFGRALAREVGSRSITVNSVAPGFIDTDMTRELPEAQREALQAQIPLGRLGQAQEIASVVAFLASDGAAYVTGATIPVNGGMYMS